MKTFEWANMECGKEARDRQQRLSGAAIEFIDSQTAIDGLLDVWLPSLIKTNEILTTAILRVKELCLAELATVAADRMLAEVELALEKAARVKNVF
jgi:hypothetical protein